MLAAIGSFIEKHRFTLLAVVLSTLAVGCALFDPTTASPTTPAQHVDRPQLDAEVAAFTAKAQAAYTDLDRKEAVKQQIIETLGGFMGQIPGIPPNVVTAVTSLLALGATGDNLRKNGVIAGLKRAVDTPAGP